MKLSTLAGRLWVPAFANDNDAYIPEVWAAESLMVLFEKLVMAQMVHRDFENEIQQHGDTVNTRRPAKFTSTRKIDSDSVTTSDATSTNVAVVLNQHHHVSFVIKDGEASKSMQSLVNLYLEPAVRAIAQAIDELLLGERYNFVFQVVGSLGTALTKSTIIAADVKLTEQLCPPDQRFLVVTPSSKGDLLGVAEFTNAEKIGDGGMAMRTGELGNLLGFQTHMSPNCKSMAVTDVVTGAINAGNLTVGSTVLTVNGLSAAIEAGTWCTIAGDMTPQVISASVGGATPTQITIYPGLASAIVTTAVVTLYAPLHVDLVAGYVTNWQKAIVVDNATIAPKTGQMLSVGSGSTTVRYGLMATPTTTSILPNRPTEAALANDAVLGLGPKGDYNFGFHKNAIGLISRPLATPPEGVGAKSAVASINGIGVRVVMTYDGSAQGTRVTVDLLCGTKTLDTNLGVVVLA